MTMTIREFVTTQTAKGINEWLEIIAQNDLSEHETIILNCAEYYNLIIVNHEANFINTIK